MFNIPMGITFYTPGQDGITSWHNQCLNLYLLKRDKYKFWWILQLPAYQHQRGSRICRSLQHVCCYFDNDDDVIVVVVVVVAGGWTMLDNCCLHSHFTFAILFQSLVAE